MSAIDDEAWRWDLRSGEVLLWTGKPGRSSLAARSLFWIVFLAVAAAITWPEFHRIVSAMGHRGSPLVWFPIFVALASWNTMVLVSLPFGLYREDYAVTSRRVLRLVRFFGHWLKSRDIDWELRAERGLIGSSVRFRKEAGMWARDRQEFSFVGIDDAELQMIHEAIGKAMGMKASESREPDTGVTA